LKSTVDLYYSRWGMDVRVSCVKLVFHVVYNIDEVNMFRSFRAVISMAGDS